VTLSSTVFANAAPHTQQLLVLEHPRRLPERPAAHLVARQQILFAADERALVPSRDVIPEQAHGLGSSLATPSFGSAGARETSLRGDAPLTARRLARSGEPVFIVVG